VNRRLPSEREAFMFLRKSGCAKDVAVHCKAVAKLAVRMAEKCKGQNMNVDVELVKIGALLHDIGRSKTHDVDHGILGGEIARSAGLQLDIVSIIERHIGGGVTPEEARRLGWPDRSYMPHTIEEKIVAYADKLVEGSEVVPIERTIQAFERKLGSQHPAISRLKELHEEMSILLADAQ